MAIANGKITNLPPTVAGWLERLDSLVEDVKECAGEDSWTPRLAGVDLTEQGFGRYEAPVLVLTRDGVVVSLVPVARQVAGASGLVETYLMPDFDRVASFYLDEDGRWFVHHAFQPNPSETCAVVEAERLMLDQATLLRVLNDIAAHA